MTEKTFVEQIKRSVKKRSKKAFFWKTNDRFSLGIPDIFAIIEGWWFAIETKFLFDYYGLNHPFGGPQISVLRQIVAAGGIAMAAVYVPKEKAAYIIHPSKLPNDGHVSYDWLQVHATKKFMIDGRWDIEEWSVNLFGDLTLHRLGKDF